MKREYFLHDFEDGNGEVEAYRHINPDGSKGGIVAKTAKVDDTVYISPHALVYNNAQVLDNVKIYDNAQVYENAKIYDNAKVYNNVRVYGYAEILDNARVANDVRVFDRAVIGGNVLVYENAQVFDVATMVGNTVIRKNARVYKKAIADGNSMITTDLTGRAINITGFPSRLTVTDNHIKVGCRIKTLEEWSQYNKQKVKDEFGKEYINTWQFIKFIIKQRKKNEKTRN